MNQQVSNRKKNKSTLLPAIVVMISMILCFAQASGQMCLAPANTVYGITNDGEIYPITVSTGAVGAQMTLAYAAPAPNAANAMGYNPVNGLFYYFKRNPSGSTQQFVSFNPTTKVVTTLATSPTVKGVNVGCVNNLGTGYYCIDENGTMYYYKIASNAWITITTLIKDQNGTNLSNMFKSHPFGDIMFDGNGTLWILPSANHDFALYNLPAPIPTTNQPAGVTVRESLPPTTLTPANKAFAGAALTPTGEIVISTSIGDNKLYRLEDNMTLTYISTMNLDGVGMDLTSCNFPLAILPYHEKEKYVAPAKKQFQVWPTVANNVLNIQTEDCKGSSYKATIIDQSGRIVKLVNVTKGLSTINISSLEPGVYFFHLQSEEGKVYNQKIAKL